MLERFKVENFKGFEHWLVMDFTARDYKFNELLQRNGLVNKAIVYGKNGIGKSNLGIAIFDVVLHLTDKERVPAKYLQNYRNLNSPDNKPVSFKYCFKFGNDRIVYEYQKLGSDFLVHEKVEQNGKTIIDYNFFGHKKFVDPQLLGSLRIDLIDNRLSVVKYIYRNKPKSEIPLLSEMVEFCEGMLWYRSLSEGNSYSGFTNGGSLLDEGLYSSGKLKDFENFLRENGLEYKLDFVSRNGIHQLVAVYGKGRKVPFSSVASTGTNALYLFFFWKISAFDKIKFLFIDEFDAFLHYESSENLIETLNKMTGFQSVLTTHNTDLMSNKLTRPDCCFVMTKGKITALCDATDRELREGHNLEKLYKSGEFDAGKNFQTPVGCL